MSLLSSTDYENIFEFYVYINKDYANFIDRVLIALNDLFGYNITAYSIFDKNENNKKVLTYIKSHCINEDVLIKYKEDGYECDLFYQEMDRIRHSNKYNSVHTYKAFDENEFFNSEYGQFLQENNMDYQVILGGDKAIKLPHHIISIFKDKKQGEFTEKELELLSFIGKAFNSSIGHYKNYLIQLEQNEAVKIFLDSAQIGFVIINQNMKVIKYNNIFIDYGNSLYNKFSIDQIVNNILETIEQNTNLNINEIPSHMESQIGKFKVILKKKIISNYDGTFSSLILIQIQKSNEEVHTSEKISKKIIDEFNLTSREVDILNLILEGCNNNEISSNLFISLSTVKSHIRNIFYKMNISSRSEVIKIINKFR